MKCKECGQERPIPKAGDVVELLDGGWGVVERYSTVWQQAEVSKAGTGFRIVPIERLRIVHGYLHIDRSA